ncbi:MAG: hypothetical protein ABI895_22160 [Deltaproteobacteria bacterium]
MSSASSDRSNSALARWALFCWGALGLFAVALALAAWWYPGGSWTEPAREGFVLWRNFWCDLVRSQALNGVANGASRRAASLGFAALWFALWCFWPVASSLLSPSRRAPVRVLGRISTFGLLGMAFLPSDAHPVLHGMVALAGGGLGMLCGTFCSTERLADEARYSLRRVSAAAAVLCGAANAALYVYVAYGGGRETTAQPSVQKLATLALLLWMSSTLARAAAYRRTHERPRPPVT